MGPIGRTSLSPDLKEIESSLRYVLFKIKDVAMDNVQNCDSYMQRMLITQGFSRSLNKIKKNIFQLLRREGADDLHTQLRNANPNCRVGFITTVSLPRAQREGHLPIQRHTLI
jgi:hypothetical protein